MYQVRHLGAAFRRNIYHTNPGNTRSKEYHSHNSQEGYSYKRKRRLSRRIFLQKSSYLTISQYILITIKQLPLFNTTTENDNNNVT